MMTPEQFSALVNLMVAVSEETIPGNEGDRMRHKAFRERAELAARMLLVGEEK